MGVVRNTQSTMLDARVMCPKEIIKWGERERKTGRERTSEKNERGEKETGEEE